MTEKNVVGMYNIKDAYPVFQHIDNDEKQVDAVDYGIRKADKIYGIRSSIGSMDPVDQWRAFSEKLKARREILAETEARLQANEQAPASRSEIPHLYDHNQAHADPDSPQFSPEGSEQARPPADNRAANAYTAQDKAFQENYEEDTVEISDRAQAAAHHLHRYLSTVKEPVPDEHLKAIETSEHDDEEQDLHALDSLRVKDVMTRRVVCVLESTTVEQVASICNRRGISGVPVLDQDQHLIGIVTVTDIIQHLVSDDAVSLFAEQGGEVLEQKSLAVLDDPIRAYMSHDVITIEPETTVQEACRLMMDHHIRRLVVVRGKKVKGVFSAQDAVHVLASADLKVEASET